MNFKILVLSSALLIGFTACTKKTDPAATSKIASVEERIQGAEAAIVKTPNFDNYIGLGLLYIESKQHNKALDAFKQAYVISPNAISANNVCSELNELGRALLAKKWCEKSLSFEPQFALAKGNLANAVAKIAAGEKQIAELKASTKLTGEQKIIEIGLRQHNLGDFEGALATWSRDKSNSKERWVVLNNMASAHLELNKLAEAEKNLSEAIKLNPEAQLVKNNMNWLNEKKTAKVVLPMNP